jgi:hypothetical protein
LVYVLVYFFVQRRREPPKPYNLESSVVSRLPICPGVKCGVYKETSDSWYPSYEMSEEFGSQRLVRVSFGKTGPSPQLEAGEWRVSVWGADDCGMERDYPLNKQGRDEAWNMFVFIISLPNITMRLLKDMGFVSA